MQMHAQFKPFTSRVHKVGSARLAQSTNRVVVCKSDAQKDGNQPVISEDVLARLRAAEEEAAKLRAQLAAVQTAKGAPAAADVIESKPKRIDSTDQRETLFTGKGASRAAWLSEADVEFFVGSSVGETADSVGPVDPEAQATVQRRLLIGGLLAAAAAGFALVPTEALRPRPPKPLYFYVVPLLRVQDLLAESGQVIADADWNTLRIILSRIQGSPNNVRDTLDAVVALLGDEGRATQTKAQALSGELIEYLDAMDYNKYFDAMPTRTISGAQNAEFVKFSSAALGAAQKKLSALLALVPQEALAAAYEQSKLY